MPIDFEMIENGWINRITMTDPWDIQMFQENFPKAVQVRNNSPHKVFGLMDLRGTHQLPPNMLRGRGSPVLHHPNSGAIAVVGANPLARAIMDVVKRLSGFSKMDFFDTEEAALVHLRQLIEGEKTSLQDT